MSYDTCAHQRRSRPYAVIDRWLDDRVRDDLEATVCLECGKDIVRECRNYQPQPKAAWRAMYGPFVHHASPREVR